MPGFAQEIRPCSAIGRAGRCDLPLTERLCGVRDRAEPSWHSSPAGAACPVTVLAARRCEAVREWMDCRLPP